MTPKEHQAEHIRLHNELDILLACYLSQTIEGGRTSIRDSIYELMKFSNRMRSAPSPAPGSFVREKESS